MPVKRSAGRRSLPPVPTEAHGRAGRSQAVRDRRRAQRARRGQGAGRSPACRSTASSRRTASAATGPSATGRPQRIYRSLHINTSRDRMAYADFPMPADYPDFPHHALMAALFRGLCPSLRAARADHLCDRGRCVPSALGPAHGGSRSRTERPPLPRAHRRQRPSLRPALAGAAAARAASPATAARARLSRRPTEPIDSARPARDRGRHGQQRRRHRLRGLPARVSRPISICRPGAARG